MNELSVDLTFNARHRRGADPRLDALLETLDRLLPAADRLLFAIPDAGQPFKVKDRAGWLRERAAADKPAILCNGDKAHEEFVSLEVLHLSARYGPGHEPALVVSLEMALSRAPYVLDLVAPIGDAIDAHRGAVSRSQADPEAESVTGSPQDNTPGIPARTAKLSDPAIPDEIEWINYWSARTCKLIEFPDETRDQDLLRSARTTEIGSWVVQITDEPTDLERPDHVQRLIELYDRFPVIGGRRAPAA
jgi:hypothetical protein